MTLEEAKNNGIAPWENMASRTDNVVIYYDGFPVTSGHKLFVPTNDSPCCVALALAEAYEHGKELVDNLQIPAFNIGMNCGELAGQTVMYPHIHFIPRREGDMENPRGGVRHIIPGKGYY